MEASYTWLTFRTLFLPSLPPQCHKLPPPPRKQITNFPRATTTHFLCNIFSTGAAVGGTSNVSTHNIYLRVVSTCRPAVNGAFRSVVNGRRTLLHQIRILACLATLHFRWQGVNLWRIEREVKVEFLHTPELHKVSQVAQDLSKSRKRLREKHVKSEYLSLFVTVDGLTVAVVLC